MTAEERYKEYLARFSESLSITEEEAEKHILTQEYKKQVYKEQFDNDRQGKDPYI